MAIFDALHSRVNDAKASACAFDLLMLNGEDLRRKPYISARRRCENFCGMVRASNTSSTQRAMATNYSRRSASWGLESVVSKKLNAPYRSGLSRTWIKVKNPKSPAATRVIDGTF